MFEEAPLVRSFRRNAAHIREALDRVERARHDDGPPTDGTRGLPDVHLQVGARTRRLKHYQAFAIPLRRALNATDRAAFARTRAAFAYAPGRPAQRLGDLDREWASLQQELDATVTLGGGPMRRGEILHAWLEAVSFFDPLDKQTTYDQLLDRLGHAAEGIATPLADRAAHLVLQLDEAAAGVLDEPLILPRSAPAGPAPRPASSWWRRIWRR
jgi:hypothetical protein